MIAWRGRFRRLGQWFKNLTVAPLTLHAGETIIFEGLLYFPGPLTEAYGGAGTLTSERLVWRKWRRAGVPSWVRHEVQVQRASAARASIRDVWYRLGWHKLLDLTLEDGDVITFELSSMAVRRWEEPLKEWIG